MWRHGDQDIEVVIVRHRRTGEWGLPKGRLNPGEPALAAALREVEEETGLLCRAESLAGSVIYRSSSGDVRASTYWLMTPIEGDLRPSDEVDAARWAEHEEVRRLLNARPEAAVLDLAALGR